MEVTLNIPDGDKTIVVDVDGVIADTDGCDYKNSNPLRYGINWVNKRYEEGYYIIILTARYDKLEFGNLARQYESGMGKPRAFLYIDDRAARVHSDSEEGWRQPDIYLKEKK